MNLNGNKKVPHFMGDFKLYSIETTSPDVISNETF